MRLGRLHKKILFSMVLLLLVMGLVIAFSTQAILFKVLKRQSILNGTSRARSIAANSLVDVLTLNIPRLNKLIENEKASAKDIAYIFVANSEDDVIAHTFQKGFPVDLIKVNRLTRPMGNIRIINTRMGIIYDIVIPIFLDNNLLGQVRVGILQSAIEKTIAVVDLIIIMITFGIIAIGVILANKFSILITRPISRLVEGIESVQKGDFSAKIDVKTDDEIGTLASSFNEMAVRLKEKMQEIKRLNIIEERNRIALDLHDGCAQELATIIKNIELCERLYKTDPERALGEMRGLRESVRGILTKTRRTIYDLKLPEDADFNLLDGINNYVKTYEKESEINVGLCVPEDMGAISPDRAKQIFYIIGEALTNIKKHSLAKNVELRLERKDSGRLNIDIKDDGKGFDTDRLKPSVSKDGGLGLIGMRQRAASMGGTVTIDSRADGGGTAVSVQIPLKAGRDEGCMTL